MQLVTINQKAKLAYEKLVRHYLLKSSKEFIGMSKYFMDL